MKQFAGDIIILHICTNNHILPYHVRFLRYGVRQKEFFVILGHFLLFAFFPPSLPNDSKNQNFEKKWKSNWRYYPFIHTCKDHMIYGSWNIRCNRQNFSSFWAIFYPSIFYPHIGSFTLLWTQKIKILKKWKKHLKILSFYKCVP